MRRPQRLAPTRRLLLRERPLDSRLALFALPRERAANAAADFSTAPREIPEGLAELVRNIGASLRGYCQHIFERLRCLRARGCNPLQLLDQIRKAWIQLGEYSGEALGKIHDWINGLVQRSEFIDQLAQLLR